MASELTSTSGEILEAAGNRLTAQQQLFDLGQVPRHTPIRGLKATLGVQADTTTCERPPGRHDGATHRNDVRQRSAFAGDAGHRFSSRHVSARTPDAQGQFDLISVTPIRGPMLCL